MIDVTNAEQMLAESKRRNELRARGVQTFEAREPAAAADVAPRTAVRTATRVIDPDEIAKLEKEIEHAGDKIVLAVGGRIIRFSHPGRTKQTPGIADRLYCFPRLRLASWWEWKTVENAQDPAQVVFEEDVTSCGQEYHAGGLGDFKHWLFSRGIVAGFNLDGTPIPVPPVPIEAP